MIARTAFCILAAVLAMPATAQTFPSKPVRIIVVYPSGGTSDAVTRLLADKLAPALGQQVLVENRGGAGGAIGMDAMAKSAPDGHTIAFGAISPLTLLPHVGKVPYDPLKDIAPLASVMYSPVYFLATPAFAGQSFADGVKEAKAKPDSLRVGTSGIATIGHLMVEQLRIAGLDFTHVPYRGGGQVITDAAGGQFAHPAGQAAHPRGGGAQAPARAAECADADRGGLSGRQLHLAFRLLRAGEDARGGAQASARRDQRRARAARGRRAPHKAGQRGRPLEHRAVRRGHSP